VFGLYALALARVQFGFTISFHTIFPAITIGLASYLAVLEGLWLWQKIKVFRDLYHFWSKIFAVTSRWGSSPVRHQLELFLGVRGRRHRAAPRL